MGLHIDIDRIKRDNDATPGVRKCGFLVNQGDKLTKQRKKELQDINRVKYGLPQEYIDSLKLPKAGDVRVYEVAKIINAKRRLSTSEQLELLYALKRKLAKKLKVLNRGYRIVDLKFQSYAEWKYKNGHRPSIDGPIFVTERLTSNIDEGGLPARSLKTTEASPVALESEATATSKSAASAVKISSSNDGRLIGVAERSERSKIIKKRTTPRRKTTRRKRSVHSSSDEVIGDEVTPLSLFSGDSSIKTRSAKQKTSN